MREILPDMRKSRINSVLKWAATVLLGAAPFTAFGANAPTEVFYERDVRPIFKAHCFHCHGEGGVRKAGVDLRLRRLIAEGGKSGQVVLPGKREASPLFRMVADKKMPPEDKALSDREIDIVGRWIEQGARTQRAESADLDPNNYISDEDRRHWAFQPIANPAPPNVAKSELVRAPLDAFLLRRLEREGLSFSAGAGKSTLVRRAYFDLLGLPPAPEDVEAFLADESDDAYGRLIDRLLASPQYGERWARRWLDVAGYADSEGYTESDTERKWAYKYRDYVIKSLNDDKPFDQFVREQLAGDEMVAEKHATFKTAILDPDAVEKLTATGFLRMAPDGTASGGIDRNLAANQTIADTIQIASTSLLGLTVACAQCHDHRYDPISQEDYYRFRAIFEPAWDWKKWRNPNGRAITLYTDEDRAQAAEIEAEAKKVDAERAEKIKFFIDRTLEWKLEAMPEKLRGPLRTAYKTPTKERSEEQTKLLKDNPSIRAITSGSLYLYDREYRVAIGKLKNERKSKLDPEFAAELKKLDERIAYYTGSMSEKILKDMAAKAKAVRGSKPEEQFIRAFTERAGAAPETHLFFRGDHTNPKQALPPEELRILISHKKPEIPLNDPKRRTTGRRLSYANHLTDGKHPLVARVLVNRIWAHHFGKGLVGTLGDFGALGEKPTHPELLDWLASDFMARGWKLKRLHKLIMTSAAYTQLSRRTPELERVDPENRLLGRMSVRRLDAEALRDSILGVSGKLNLELHGKPAPVKEDDVGQIVIGKENKDGEGKPGKEIPLDGAEYRRSLYVQSRRSRPLATLDTFDLPAMSPNCDERSASTVAPQALMLMNSKFIGDFAKHFADRVNEDTSNGSMDARIARAWELAYASAPTADELAGAKEFVAAQTKVFEANKAKGEKISSEQLALRAFCQALMSANRFLYVD